MVRVLALEVVDVQRDLGVVDEAPEEFLEQIDIEIADPGAGILDAVR